MNMTMRAVLAAGAALLFTACSQESQSSNAPKAADAATGELVALEQFSLDNGLNVILHIDRSDPVVAVALTAHVGSSREKPGRTGFAHLFEHLLFLESENLGKGGLDEMSARIGGSGANGSTNRDRTNYYQTVPKDALEKMIWAEADKLGYFINTVTDPVLAKEKEVVKNEKRQSVDNRPYGHTFQVIDEALYPADHPYHWQVIGSLEDLQAATLDDVKEFYRRWYTPNNVTLVIAGDFDAAQARAFVEKYFAEIPRGEDVEPLPKQPASLAATKLLYHEDNFAQLPELTLTWPSVPAYDPDSYALGVLSDLLTVGKTAPLNEVLIDEKKLTGAVDMFGYESELAGQHMLSVRAFAGVDLDDVKAALDEAFARFEQSGVDPDDLDRVKITQEVAFYGSIGSVIGKAFSLAEYDLFSGGADNLNADIAKIRAVTAQDVMRVYNNKYIKDRPFVAASFTPKGAPELALDGSVKADIAEEKIVQGAEDSFDPSIAASYERTPSSFDRTVEPPYGEKPTVKVPPIWDSTLADGLKVYGVEDNELPLARFELAIDGGHYLDSLDRPGAANLLAAVLTKGTARRTTAELEEAVAALGAEINVYAASESIVLSGQTLSRNFAETMALVQEILLEPRWDEAEFALAKTRTVNSIRDAGSQPGVIAARAFALVNYGENNILAHSVLGDAASVEAMTLEDVKAFYAANLAPNVANFRIVGAVKKTDALKALGGLAKGWKRRDVAFPDYAPAAAPTKSTVYFYDAPGAKQSVLAFGYPSLKRADADFYPATVMNYILGGGGFASRLTQELRESKGYTYGAGSVFNGGRRGGEFRIYSNVRSNVTLEASALVKSMLEDYGATFTPEDLAVAKSFLSKSKARAFETLSAKLGLLENIADYGLPRDYIQQQDAVIDAITVDEIHALADKYLRPDAMNYVVVGDGQTQAARLEALGFGAPVMLNERLDSFSR